MSEEKTWRDVLGQILHDAKERQRLASIIGVHVVTLNRWITGISQPRQSQVIALLDALPAHRQVLRDLLSTEYPQLSPDLPLAQESNLEIPSEFYTRILQVNTTLPVYMREETVVTMLLEQIATHLDPAHTGLIIFLSRCVPPAKPGGQVRSIRKTHARGTGPWRQTFMGQDVELQTHFFGAESQHAYTIIARHALAAQKAYTLQGSFPATFGEGPESTLAVPLLFTDKVAGSLSLLSARPQTFNERVIELVENYAHLLATLLEPGSFYPLNAVQFGVMPRRDVQRPLLATLQQRVLDRLIISNNTGSSESRAKIELRIWQELEEELFQHTLQDLQPPSLKKVKEERTF